ncbi:MAG: TolC family protein [Planctomycetes bacterium]|nr:TolC family protein [Planctomycetota bacterium]
MTRGAAALASVLLAGCVTVPRDAGFDDVARLAEQRGAPPVHWFQGEPEDARVEARVEALLETELDAVTATRIALLRSPRLQAVYEELGVAQAALVQAGLLSNPVLRGEVRLPVAGGGLGIEVGVAQEFLDLFLLPLRRRLAGAAFVAAKLRVTGEVLDVVAETRAAFYDLQAAAQLRELRATAVAALEAAHELARRLREAGNIPALDLALQRAQYEEERLELVRAEAQVELARARVDRLMGVFGAEARWRFARRLPELPPDDEGLARAERQAVGRSLELGALEQEVLVAGEQVGLARTFAFLPSLTLGASAEREPDGGWGVGPQLALPLPIFDQGQARIAAARARLRQRQALVAATALQVRAATRAAVARVLAARARVEHQRRTVLPARQLVLDETQLQYNAMQVGAFQLLDARRAQIEAGVRFVRDQREYWVARAELDRLTAGRLGRGVRLFDDEPGGGRDE